MRPIQAEHVKRRTFESIATVTRHSANDRGPNVRVILLHDFNFERDKTIKLCQSLTLFFGRGDLLISTSMACANQERLTGESTGLAALFLNQAVLPMLLIRRGTRIRRFHVRYTHVYAQAINLFQNVLLLLLQTSKGGALIDGRRLCTCTASALKPLVGWMPSFLALMRCISLMA